MGWRVRRRVRLARGVYLNFGKSGLTSISAGARGARFSWGRRGRRATVGLPGSGISYSIYEPHPHPAPPAVPAPAQAAQAGARAGLARKDRAPSVVLVAAALVFIVLLLAFAGR